MKIIFQITVFALLCLNVVFYFPACTKDTPGSKQQQAITLESLVSSYNVGISAEPFKAQLLEGTMEVLTLPSREVIFFLKQADQMANDVFIAHATDVSVQLNADLGQVKIAYLRQAVAIQDQTGQIYTFTIGEGKGHELIQKLTSTWTGQGFGLSFKTQVQESISDYKGLASTSELRSVACDCEKARGGCDSGGEGATDCSISSNTIGGGSCSVSCGSGYYACCNR